MTMRIKTKKVFDLKKKKRVVDKYKKKNEKVQFRNPKRDPIRINTAYGTPRSECRKKDGRPPSKIKTGNG